MIRDFNGNAPFVHYDADIVFNATPDEIEAQFDGLTFMLQGCPAYTRVEEASWQDKYLSELNRFVADMEGYSDDAWRQRDKFLPTVKARNSALWNRRLLSSDQDLLQFLTLSDKLPNDNAEAVNARCSTALFQNPLLIGLDIHLPLPLTYERINGIDYIGHRKVAFWHMQSNFCEYLGFASFRRQMMISGRVPWLQGKRTISYNAFRLARRLTTYYTRGGLLQRYFGMSNDLGFLFNKKCFWQDNVFY